MDSFLFQYDYIGLETHSSLEVTRIVAAGHFVNKHLIEKHVICQAKILIQIADIEFRLSYH